MDATPPFLRGRPGARGPSDSAEGSTASATPSWRPQTPSQMEREHECDRRCASAAEACVASSIIEERAPIGGVAPYHQPEEHGVIAGGDGAALLALDVGDDAVDDRDAPLVLAVTHASKPILLLPGKTPRQRFLLGGQNVEHEVRTAFQRRVHVMDLVDRNEHERRIGRDDATELAVMPMGSPLGVRHVSTETPVA